MPLLSDASALYVGEQEVTAIYKGSSLVYEALEWATAKYAGMEANNTSEFDDINQTLSTFAASNEWAAVGTYSAKATYTGAGVNGLGRGLFDLRQSGIGEGDEIRFSTSFKLPTGYKAAQQGAMDLIRWDTQSGSGGVNPDQVGVRIISGNLYFMVQKLNVSTEYPIENLNVLSENVTHHVEVYQKLSATDGQAITRVKLDGVTIGTTTDANMFTLPPDWLRVGVVSIAPGTQTNNLTVYVDECKVECRPAVPAAPTSVSALGGNAQAAVSFTAPTWNGGSAITGYTVTSSGGHTATGSSSPITVTGLTNGQSYTFTVKATSALGDSVASTASNSVTPAVPLSVFVNDPASGTAGQLATAATINTGGPVSLIPSWNNYVRTASNRWRPNANFAWVTYAGTPPDADWEAEADYYFADLSGTNRTFGMSVRNTSGVQTAYVAQVLVTGGAASVWRIQKFVTGTGTTVGSSASAAAVTSGSTQNVRLRAVGTTLTMYVNDVQVCTGTDSAISGAGLLGIRTENVTPNSDTQGVHISNLTATEV